MCRHLVAGVLAGWATIGRAQFIPTFLLMESGSFLLLESGYKLELE